MTQQCGARSTDVISTAWVSARSGTSAAAQHCAQRTALAASGRRVWLPTGTPTPLLDRLTGEASSARSPVRRRAVLVNSSIPGKVPQPRVSRAAATKPTHPPPALSGPAILPKGPYEGEDLARSVAPLPGLARGRARGCETARSLGRSRGPATPGSPRLCGDGVAPGIPCSVRVLS